MSECVSTPRACLVSKMWVCCLDAPAVDPNPLKLTMLHMDTFRPDGLGASPRRFDTPGAHPQKTGVHCINRSAKLIEDYSQLVIDSEKDFNIREALCCGRCYVSGKIASAKGSRETSAAMRTGSVVIVG